MPGYEALRRHLHELVEEEGCGGVVTVSVAPGEKVRVFTPDAGSAAPDLQSATDGVMPPPNPYCFYQSFCIFDHCIHAKPSVSSFRAPFGVLSRPVYEHLRC